MDDVSESAFYHAACIKLERHPNAANRPCQKDSMCIFVLILFFVNCSRLTVLSLSPPLLETHACICKQSQLLTRGFSARQRLRTSDWTSTGHSARPGISFQHLFLSTFRLHQSSVNLSNKCILRIITSNPIVTTISNANPNQPSTIALVPTPLFTLPLPKSCAICAAATEAVCCHKTLTRTKIDAMKMSASAT